MKRETRYLYIVLHGYILTHHRYFSVDTNGFLFLQLHDKYHDFVTDSEREQLIAKLQEVEDWLYEDGEDETKGVYIAKLEELKKVKNYEVQFLLVCHFASYSTRQFFILDKFLAAR